MKQKNVILMVVAVGCGLVAAFLTSQMSAKGQVEQVDVLVAAKDLPVGTVITRDEVDKIVKVKRIPKDGLPPAFVADKEQLIDKRLSRPLHAEDTFNPQDLNKGGAITLPSGYNMVSLPLGVGQAAAGFVGPGSRVNVIATLRLTHKLHSFPLLVNMLVVAVNTATTYEQNNNGAFPNLSMVSFAVKDKEALVLSLAKTRGCSLELVLRHPETSDANEKNDKLDEVVKLLSDERTGEKAAVVMADKPEEAAKKADAQAAATVKVPVARQDIAPNTTITNDLIAEAFELKDVPKDFAADAVTDFGGLVGKAFKSGVAKNQWVTRGMVGEPAAKPAPHETFNDPKPADPKPEAVKKNYHDVSVHTSSGTVIHRYEEYEPGKWKKVAELNQGEATKSRPPEAPKPDDGEKKID